MEVPESGTEEVDRFPFLFRRTETSADQAFSFPSVLGDLVDRLESQTTEEDDRRASDPQDSEDGSHDQPQDLQGPTESNRSTRIISIEFHSLSQYFTLRFEPIDNNLL